VTASTHERGHTLDLVTSLGCEGLNVNITDIDRAVSSDHFAVVFTVDCSKPPLPKREVEVRKWKDIDPERLERSLQEMIAQLATAEDPFASYDALLTTILYKNLLQRHQLPIYHH
jgi:predicted amino acid-binding ACT domain protein